MYQEQMKHELSLKSLLALNKALCSLPTYIRWKPGWARVRNDLLRRIVLAREAEEGRTFA